MTKTIKKQWAEEIQAGALMDQIDSSLEPHVLTDKSKTKVVGCRVPTCKRPCIVTYFASAAKTACNEHRDRHAPITVVHELKSDLEPHVLTDKEETKTVPCRHCGRPCVVTLFASAPKVACKDCRKSAPRPRKTTEYKPGEGGRMVAETKTSIASEHDLAWSEWTINQPFHFSREWTDEDKAEHDKLKQERADTHAALTSNRKTRWLMRGALEDLRRKLRKPDIQKEIDDLESKIETLEAEEISFEDQMRIAQEAADRLARIAYFRAAFAHDYRVESRDGQRYLVGREKDVRIPGDFLEADGYAHAEATVPVMA